MKGKYKTNNGTVTVAEFDPSSKKVRVGDEWISESIYKNWTPIEKITDIQEEHEPIVIEEEVPVEVIINEEPIIPEEPVEEKIIEEEKPKAKKKNKKK